MFRLKDIHHPSHFLVAPTAAIVTVSETNG